MKDDPKLLIDLFEMLLRAEGILEESAIPDEDGGNDEAQLLAEIQDNEYEAGLLTRVKNAMKKDVLG